LTYSSFALFSRGFIDPLRVFSLRLKDEVVLKETDLNIHDVVCRSVEALPPELGKRNLRSLATIRGFLFLLSFDKA